MYYYFHSALDKEEAEKNKPVGTPVGIYPPQTQKPYYPPQQIYYPPQQTYPPPTFYPSHQPGYGK